jgi:hypothetical protein
MPDADLISTIFFFHPNGDRSEEEGSIRIHPLRKYDHDPTQHYLY